MAYDCMNGKRASAIVAAMVATFATGASHAQDHLLITEVVVTPNPSTFIEIMNPTDAPVDLTDYYLSDRNAYALLAGIIGGSEPAGGNASDFIARFPAGASIGAGEIQVIAFDGDGFLKAFLASADYELWGTDDGAADMLAPFVNAIGATAGLMDTGEHAVLFYWNGIDDLVQDVDMLNIGTPGADIANKTGLMVDGPDADAIMSTYAPDAHTMTNQGSDPGMNESTKRIALEAGWELRCGVGNGVFDQDETSENILQTWDSVFTVPDPGAHDALVVIPLDRTWDGAPDGRYCDPMSWSPPGGSPTRVAVFDLPGSYTVDIAGAQHCERMHISSIVTLDQDGGGSVYELNLTSTTDPSLVVGSSGLSGSLTTLAGGEILAQTVHVGVDGPGELVVWGTSEVSAEAIQVGAYPSSAGELDVRGMATVTVAATVQVDRDSTLKGRGTIDGDVVATGTTLPGTPFFPEDTLDITGTLDQLGVLEMELGGAALDEYDRIVVGGTAVVGGALHVSLTNAFVPTSGMFSLIEAADVSGRFNVAELPDIGPDMFLEFSFPSPFAGPAAMSVTPAPVPAMTSFEPPSVITVTGEPTDFVIVDLDGVLGPDIAMTIPDMTLPQFGDGEVLVLYNDGTGGFSITPFAGGGSQSFTVGEEPTAIATGLFDNNDSYDIAVVNKVDGTVSLLFNDGAGNLSQPSTDFVLISENPIDIAAGDFDAPPGGRPGQHDLVISTEGQGVTSDPSVEVWSNDGTGGFTNTFVYTNIETRGADPLDVDDDKDLDVILVLQSEIQILENQAIGGGFLPTPIATIPIANTAELLITETTDGNAGYDLDQDGDSDIVTVNTDGTVSIAVNSGGFIFGRPVTLDVGTGGVDLAAGDYDLDDDLDLAVLADDGDTLYHLRNDTSAGQLAFTRVSMPLGTTSDGRLVRSGDVDQDGADDLVVIGANSVAAAFAGTDPTSQTLVGISNAVVATPCPGDTDDDGTVNVNDLNNVILDWGTDGSANGGDITGALPDSGPDGTVNVNDLNAVIVGWGACP